MPKIQFRRGRYGSVQWTWDGDVRLPSGRWKCRHEGCGEPAKSPMRFYCGEAHRDAFQAWLLSQVPPDWPTVRSAALRRDGYRCTKCGAHGKDVILEVDHLKPVATHPDLEFELSNVRTLCRPCHARHGARPNTRLYRAANVPGQQRLA